MKNYQHAIKPIGQRATMQVCNMKSHQRGLSLPMQIGLILLVSLLGLALLQMFNENKNGSDGEYAKLFLYASQALNMSVVANNAMQGSVKAFDALERDRRRLGTVAEVGELVADMEGLKAEDVRRAWGQLRQGLDGVIAGKPGLLKSVNAAARTTQLKDEITALLDELGPTLGPAQQEVFITVSQRLAAELEVIVRNAAALATDDPDRRLIEPSLSDAANDVDQLVNALAGTQVLPGVPVVRGDQAVEKLEAIKSRVQELNTQVQNALSASPEVLTLARSSAQMASASEGMYASLAGIRAATEKSSTPWWQSSWLPMLLLASAVLSCLAYMVVAAWSNRKPKAVVQSAVIETGDKNQEAILRLLDEMGNLADGDLTVEATVTEDITGAIADSINYAIEALRELVSTIDSAAESTDSAARQTQAAANHLTKASENQSKQVSSATESIAKMAASIEQVSVNAERSSEVARHSVEIAHKGGEAVRRTIDGMNTIRETIQDTSKRIKRLGESSQEIGNIVELINDIADQTNILALNASIQASMAGEAGRGFGVVADEVQRLAERSTNATKQIEVLVKTIQSDTNEAVVSMERSTTDVVSGALLAENAGAALDEIEKVSNQIASLVQNISGSARQQATVATDVTRNMGVLQEISAQTAENTSATSHSIGKLAEMASQMRRSVDGFTLPKETVKEEPDSEDEMLFKLANEENEFIDTLIVKEHSKS